MQGQFITTQVRRANRNLLAWNGSVLVLMLVLTWLSRVYWHNFFFGPFHVNDDSLLAIATGPGGGLLAYLNLDKRELTPTGFTEQTMRNDKPHTVYPYFVTPVGDRLLLVKAQTQAEGAHLIGPLYRLADNGADAQVITEIIQKRPELNGRFLPVILDATVAFPVFGWVCLAIVIPLSLLCLVNLAKGLLRIINPHRHPMARPAEVSAEIDREVAEDSVERFGSVLLTRSWLLQPTTFGLRRIRLADTLWVCELTGARYGLVFYFRNGRTTGVLLKRTMAAPALQTVINHVPWVLVGFDVQRLREWQKRRDDMIAVVDERRKQFRGRRGS